MNRARAARDALLSKGYHSPTVNTPPIRNEHRTFHSSSPPPSPPPSPLSPSSADSQVDEEEPPPSDAEESEEEEDADADSDVENVLRPPTPPPSGRGAGEASNTLTSNARGGTPPTAYSRLDPAPSASPDTLVHRTLSSPPSNHDFTAQSPPSTQIRQELPRQTPPGRQSPPPSPPSPPRTAASSFSGARSRDRDICYACGLSGHWAQDCPNDRGSPSPDTSPSFRRCGVSGHWAQFKGLRSVEAPTQFNFYTPIDGPSSPGSLNRITYSQSTPGRNTIASNAVKMGTGQKLAEPDDHFSSLVSCLLYIAPLLRLPKKHRR
ncbi:hypothetical protein DFH08DRAFT_827977 [Mycena albidolilacea]|uniref:CCHC-type domain-containing protein n=1 Tax=Mycena albidolilacea TaxID=1033008 RepID=A0AAD6YXF2_9AGAR|nr:hypothetical protein DFH08DRAFT_827977 [Mycena albidolilacea]